MAHLERLLIAKRRLNSEHPICEHGSEIMRPNSPATPCATPHHSEEEWKLSLKHLFEHRDNADITFMCSDGVSIKAHSFVLWPRSDYFDTICNRWPLEATTRQMRTEEHSPMIHRMLKHCYMLKYDDEPLATSEHDLTRLHVNVYMYALGEKYLLQALKKEAYDRFRFWIAREERLDIFLEVLPIIYSTTPESDNGLRVVARKYGVCNWDRLLEVRGFAETVAKNPAWAIEMISMTRPVLPTPITPIFHRRYRYRWWEIPDRNVRAPTAMDTFKFNERGEPLDSVVAAQRRNAYYRRMSNFSIS